MRCEHTFGTLAPVDGLRWPTVEAGRGPQGELFDADELAGHHVGTGEWAGYEFLHVNARSLISAVPPASRMPFRHTINVYRGCSHACTYCLAGDTPVLLADGGTCPIAELRPGDVVLGTERRGAYRRYVPSEVLDHWSTRRPAWEVRLADGTRLVASGDHRFLTRRGWKHVVGTGAGPGQRPHLTSNDRLVGPGGGSGVPPEVDSEGYRAGYLCGMLRGDAAMGTYTYQRGHRTSTVHRFRLALADGEALDRSRQLLESIGVTTTTAGFPVPADQRPMRLIRTQRSAHLQAIAACIAWPERPTHAWRSGFLAGLFDAEGSYSGGILRISNADPAILEHAQRSLSDEGFDARLEPAKANGVCSVRIAGGRGEHLRFFATTAPAIRRKLRVVDGAVKGAADLRVVGIRPLGQTLPMWDITTATGDFVAGGVINHNCFARPTHEYLGLGIGEDFERRIVVKVNAVERLEAELSARRWAGHHIAMGTNTDPYQRCEGRYRLTRGVVEVLGRRANPFSILTKSTLVVRDLDVLAEAAARTDVRLNLSIGTLDEGVWRLAEPGTPAPRLRVEAVRRLNEAGIPCGVLIAPVLPGLSDRPEQLAEVVDAVVAAGAVSVSTVALHLRGPLREHYLGWLRGVDGGLAAATARRYQGAHLPRAEQEALTALVRGMVERARRRHGDPEGRRLRWVEGRFAERVRAQMGGDDPVPPDPPPAAGEQLPLGWGSP